MIDVVDKATRSRMMAGIRARNTKPEVMLRSALHRRGFRFRLHAKGLPGKPDIVLRRYHAAIFVNGCFWHGHDCLYFKLPATRTEFWREKIAANRRNDVRAIDELCSSGWRVAVVWECATRVAPAGVDNLIDSLAVWITGNDKRGEFRK